MSKTIYDPISEALQLEPIEFHFDINDYKHERVGSWGIEPYERTPERRKALSKKMKKVNAESDYWKTGIENAAKANTGRKLTQEHKDASARGCFKEIEIEGVTYKSGKEAAKALNVIAPTISNWVKKNNGSRYGIKIPTGSNQYTRR